MKKRINEAQLRNYIYKRVLNELNEWIDTDWGGGPTNYGGPYHYSVGPDTDYQETGREDEEEERTGIWSFYIEDIADGLDKSKIEALADSISDAGFNVEDIGGYMVELRIEVSYLNGERNGYSFEDEDELIKAIDGCDALDDEEKEEVKRNFDNLNVEDPDIDFDD